jgi:hypothetical protein
MGQDGLQAIREEMERAYRPLKEASRIEGAAGDHISSLESPVLRSAISVLHASYALVGQLPPEPPTFRGRVGARLIRIVNRMLFWYTPQIVYFQYSALRALEEQAKILDRAEKRIRHLESELGEVRVQNEKLRHALEGLKNRSSG